MPVRDSRSLPLAVLTDGECRWEYIGKRLIIARGFKTPPRATEGLSPILVAVKPAVTPLGVRCL